MSLEIAVLGLLGTAAGWTTAVRLIPYCESSRLWRRFQRHGLTVNMLGRASVRNARHNEIPTDNADTINRSCIIDLRAGPLLFEADVPRDSSYWSIAIYSHDTTTLEVVNDRQCGPGTFRLVLRRPHQPAPKGIQQVVCPTSRGFLVIRMVMPDRNDKADVARLKRQIMAASVQPWVVLP